MSKLFKITDIITNTIDSIANSNVVKPILINPFMTSILITLILVLLIIIVFRKETFIFDEPSKYYVKIGLLVFATTSVLLFFQNYLIMNETNDKIGANEFENILNNTNLDNDELLYDITKADIFDFN